MERRDAGINRARIGTPDSGEYRDNQSAEHDTSPERRLKPAHRALRWSVVPHTHTACTVEVRGWPWGVRLTGAESEPSDGVRRTAVEQPM